VQATKHNGTLYVSGQIAMNPETGNIDSPDDVEAQAEQALKNLGAVLEAGGSGFDRCLKVGVYLIDMGDCKWD
jgi:2-iminobutanoate/2-iminopropanoate deaminase